MKKITAAVCALLFLFPAVSHAALVSSGKYGYTVDLPEGFSMADGTEDESLFLFTSDRSPVSVLLVAGECSSGAPEFLASTLSKLGSSSVPEKVAWRRRECAFCEFGMSNGALSSRNLGVAVCAPLSQEGTFACVISFCPEKSFGAYRDLCLSAADSLCVDEGSFRVPGIVAEHFVPRGKSVPLNMRVSGTEIATSVCENDSAANRSVIDREFSAFKRTLGDGVCGKLALAAWQRFYRAVARDALGRLSRVAFDVQAALEDAAAEKDAETPDAALAQMLLSWAQDLRYERRSADVDKADFSDVVSVLRDCGSDCDSRSLLLAVLLKNMGMDSCFFVSSAYSHALLGVVLDGKLGQAIEIDGKRYLLGDTTVRGLTFGRIDATQADKSKWLEVEFPF